MKKLVFVTEARFITDANGIIYADASFSNDLWNRYLKVFDHLYVLARVKKDDKFVPNKESVIDLDTVSFIEIPYYVGPLEYLKKKTAIKKVIKNNVETLQDCKYICRIPGQLGSLVIEELQRRKINYAVEVVGDPDDVFAPGTMKHPLRAYFRSQMVQSLKKNIQNANAVLYVTKFTLQKKYPARLDSFTTYASDVQLVNSNENSVPKKWQIKSVVNIVSVGSLEQMYKSPDIVLQALSILNNKQTSVKYQLLWVGDGKYKEEMIRLSKDLKLEEQVKFIGNVNKEQVFEQLSNADVFVLASRTEGLPRAIIEAMSVGLPVVGTRVGGIPELIEDSVLVEKNNPIQLADTIERLSLTEDFYNQQANRNLKESIDYQEEFLLKKRFDFYNYIKEN